MRSALGLAPLVLALALAAAGCGGDPGGTAAGPVASLPSTAGGSPGAITSPATGLLTRIDAEGLTKVRGFTLRAGDGTETAFTIGVLENGAEFPPGHLAEHMATSSPVRVFFRDEGGTLVVYRLEDAP